LRRGNLESVMNTYGVCRRKSARLKFMREAIGVHSLQ
jgi:hypothetical protein